MAVNDILKAHVTVENIRYYKEETDWGIIQVSITKVKEGTPYDTEVCCKGTMPYPIIGNEYYMTATEVNDAKFGQQYELTYFAALAPVMTDRYSQRRFLSSLFTENQVDAMYEALQNPFETLEKHDYESLVTVRGCGAYNAVRWIKRFDENYAYGRIGVELEEFNLTTNMIKKLTDYYKSADLVIQKVKDNPYVLTHLDGVGFLTADAYALKSGVHPHSVNRVTAFIQYYLEQAAACGHSYVYAQELMDSLLGTLGEDIPDLVISDAMGTLKDRLWCTDDHEKIGLKYYRYLEENIARELLRLRDGENKFEYSNWRDTLEREEALQGWKYSEEQVQAVEAALENNVLLIQGLPGTGKTTTVNILMKILKNYSANLCALAGKAAARIAEVAQTEGSTIHRLLGWGKEGFMYNKDFPLFTDIIVLDEISMVDARLFYNLLQAIPTGSKLIMLGDVGQLESIGVGNVAYDMLHSDKIPHCILTQIHRQAAKSAVITESHKINNMEQIVPKDWTGIETRGELQDLTLDCYSDRNNTFFKVVQYFQEELNQVDSIMDIQIIVPQKDNAAGTHLLNNTIQEIYNPASKKKNDTLVYYNKNYKAILREGDKVINVRNNYSTIDADTGANVPIFNGNIGIIRSIDTVAVVVDFAEIGTIMIPRKRITDIELAYAITGHKMQGSEASHIIIGLDFGSYTMLTKNWVYTALTRARQHCTLVAETGALHYAISQEQISHKRTHLQDCLATMEDVQEPVYTHPSCPF